MQSYLKLDCYRKRYTKMNSSVQNLIKLIKYEPRVSLPLPWFIHFIRSLGRLRSIVLISSCVLNSVSVTFAVEIGCPHNSTALGLGQWECSSGGVFPTVSVPQAHRWCQLLPFDDCNRHICQQRGRTRCCPTFTRASLAAHFQSSWHAYMATVVVEGQALPYLTLSSNLLLGR